jgi:hypothetical protein
MRGVKEDLHNRWSPPMIQGILVPNTGRHPGVPNWHMRSVWEKSPAVDHLERLRVLLHQMPDDFQRCLVVTCTMYRKISILVGYLERLRVLLHQILDDFKA